MASDIEVEDGVRINACVGLGSRDVGRLAHFNEDLG
jgi:hypothetical protein